jgi:predicted dinucleotide-binding enzyme
MKVGIVGAGRMGQTLARLALRAGHEVKLANGADAEVLRTIVTALGAGASGGPTDEAARFGDLCVMATRWEQVPDAARQCGDMTGRVVVDVTNNRFGPGAGDVYDLRGRSSSEVVAGLLPGARLVKAFNNQPISVLAEIMHADPGAPPALFLAGDDPASKAVVAEFIREIGAIPIDAGDLAVGGRLMSTGTGPLTGISRLLSASEAAVLLDRARARPDDQTAAGIEAPR